MTNLPPNSLPPQGSVVNPASSSISGARPAETIQGNWFSDNAANAPLIDINPTAQQRSMSPQELATEVLSHILVK